MSDCESISWSEIPSETESESDMSDATGTMNVPYGQSTIPLHPALAQYCDILITEENKDTFEQTPETVLASVTNWGPSIAYVRDELITYELCKVAVEDNEHSICSIKPHLLTKEEYYTLCLIAATKNGWTMRHIPLEVQTQELCDAGIKSMCGALQFCRNKFKTYENCLSAVSRNGQTIEHVPKNLINEDMCLAAAKAGYPCLDLIPREFLTRDLCHIAVAADGEDIKHVPDDYMSSELAWLAVTSPSKHDSSGNLAGANIQYISGKYLTKESIVESARRWYSTYTTIPKECITEEIEDAVLEVSPYCIKYMNQTPERCLRAIKQSPYAIERQIEKENITKEMADYILTHVDMNKYRIDKEILDYLKTYI